MEPCNRLFYALKPTCSALSRIGDVQREYCPAHAIPNQHWHVTLDILPDCASVSDALIRKLKQVGAEVDVAGFVLRFERIVGLGGWVGLRAGRRSPRLAKLHHAIRDALNRIGLPPRDGWSFNPHLTLGYPSGDVFSRAVEPVEWDVDEIVLIHSHLGQTRHDIVGRWPLSPELPLFQ